MGEQIRLADDYVTFEVNKTSCVQLSLVAQQHGLLSDEKPMEFPFRLKAEARLHFLNQKDQTLSLEYPHDLRSFCTLVDSIVFDLISVSESPQSLPELKKLAQSVHFRIRLAVDQQHITSDLDTSMVFILEYLGKSRDGETYPFIGMAVIYMAIKLSDIARIAQQLRAWDNNS